MPKKKTPVNAFYFFMLERKAQFEKNGHKFPNGLKDVAEEVGPEWQVLPAASKKKYEDMAKEEKARQKGDTARKYTNQHNSFDYWDRTTKEETDAKNKMYEDIQQTITLLCTAGKIAEHKFYLIHANYFCITEGETFHPAELAVTEFSLAEGVGQTYHTIINSGRIPLGYRHDAMLKSETVHRIPLEPKDGETRFHTIWNNVKDILEGGRSQHGGNYPPMYTMPDNVNLNTSMSCVKNVVRYLCESVDDNPEDFKIYAIEKLFYELQTNCVKFSEYEERMPGHTASWPSVPYACSKLEEDTYNYTSHIACSFHLNEDHVVNCSKSFVQRWAFLICDECCQYLKIPLVPGKHVPLKSDVGAKTRFEERELERGTSAKAAPKSFTFIDHNAGGKAKVFAPVELQRPPLAHPTVQSSLARTAPKPAGQSSVYAPIDTSEASFPSIPLGRGRGVRYQRGVGRGSEPPSYSAAMQSRK